MRITLGLDLPRRRADAIARVNEKYDRLVTHCDLVSIIRGDFSQIMERERVRLSLISQIQQAKTADAIEALTPKPERQTDGI